MPLSKIVADSITTDAVGADALSSSAIAVGDLPSGSILQFKKAVTQNASSIIITASSNPGTLYGANTAARTYALAQTVTITPTATSSILYCISQVGWSASYSHTTGAHGSIITLNDASSIDNSDYPWYSEAQYVDAANQPYWPNDVVFGTFSPNTTSQQTIRLRPYAYRESGTKTGRFRGTSLIVMEIAV
jgi:hypothetical protein